MLSAKLKHVEVIKATAEVALLRRGLVVSKRRLLSSLLLELAGKVGSVDLDLQTIRRLHLHEANLSLCGHIGMGGHMAMRVSKRLFMSNFGFQTLDLQD